MKKRLFILGLILVSLVAMAGCVSIYDSKVQVQTPGQVDQFNRNIVEQCTPHVYPHRLIQAMAGTAYPYLQNGCCNIIGDQATFDQYWTGLTVQLDQDKMETENLKPVIDWTQQTAYFINVPMNSSCTKVKPYGDVMTTDCYDITISLYTWEEGDNCQGSITNYPVYVYIYPRAVSQPVGIKWYYPSPIPTFTPTATPSATPTATATPTSEDDE